MNRAPEFALLPIRDLRPHEEIDEEDLAGLESDIRQRGVFADPIWVARGSLVILNGHHRVAALRHLGATRVPAWVFDYESDVVGLEPWRPGLPITKAEVLRRAREGHLFPPKTTRHRLRVDLPAHPTPLTQLLGRAGPKDHPPGGTVHSGGRGSRGSG